MRLRPTAAEARDRRRRAVELRLTGMTYAQIAQRLDWSGPSGAHQEIARALRLAEEPADRLRDLEVAQLDALFAAVWPRARSGHLRSVDAALGIMKRRARLLGLDWKPEPVPRPLVPLCESRA